MKLQLCGLNFYLRRFQVADVNDEYIGWLSDPMINRFLEVRFNIPDINSAKSFIASIENSDSYLFFGIFTKQSDKMIGTISLKIDQHHQIASYGYLVGDRSYWGSTAAVESICLLLDHAFVDLNLNRVYGGAYLANIGSIFNFKKLGFVQEGRFRSHGLVEGKQMDILQYGILKAEWLERRQALTYRNQQ